MRRFIFLITIVMLFSSTMEPRAIGFGKQIVFMPFYDESGYRGPWKLKYEVPEMIGDMIGGSDDYFYIVPMDSVTSVMEKPPRKNIFLRFFGLFLNRKERQRILSDFEVLSVARKI